MERLTVADWRTINQGLAVLDASSFDSVHWCQGEDEEAFLTRIRAVRRKVHERLPERREE